MHEFWCVPRTIVDKPVSGASRAAPRARGWSPVAKSLDSGMPYEVREVFFGLDLPADDRIDLWRNHIGGNHGTGKFLFSSPKKFWGRTWMQRALAKTDDDPNQLRLIECSSAAILYDRSDK